MKKMRVSRIQIVYLIIMLAFSTIATAQIKNQEPVTGQLNEVCITLPSFFSNGMVLQRDMEIPIWGKGIPKTGIEIIFKGIKYSTNVEADGKWKTKLQSSEEGGPYDLVINSGNDTIKLNDILIGDVWFCSGQSNMEFELYKAKEKYKDEISSSENKFIRHFKVNRRIDFNANDDVETNEGWVSASPSTVTNFTAAGYFFAKNLYEKYNVPIGLINCTFGGTPAQAWINETALKSFPGYYNEAVEFKDINKVDSIKSHDTKIIKDWYDELTKNDLGLIQQWQKPSCNFDYWKIIKLPDFWKTQTEIKDVEGGVVWFKKKIIIPKELSGKQGILYLGNIVLQDSTYFNGVFVGSTGNKHIARKYTINGSLIKEGINILTVRVINQNNSGGFIKDKPYKLEIDGQTFDLNGDWNYKLGYKIKPLLRNDITRFQDKASSMYHGMLSPLVNYGIKGVIWYQGEANTNKAEEYKKLFPALIKNWRNEWQQGSFPFLFVQLPNLNPPKLEPDESNWAQLREAQLFTLSLPNTGMAVTYDIGEWNDIHPLDKATVGYRLFLAAQKIAYNNKSIVFSGPIYRSMKIDGNKIILSFSNVGSGLSANGGEELRQFSIADSTKKFVWAKAEISNDKVIVWSDEISSPIAVRYAWADNPEGANLYNEEGLPASTFRTDDWQNYLEISKSE